jgi:uncharacterized membrane protein
MSTYFSNLGPLNSLLLGSGIAAAGVMLYLAFRTRRPRVIVLTLLIVAVSGWIVYSVAPVTAGTRGEGNTATLIISYVAMVLGMTAHTLYAEIETGKKKLRFRWLPFLMPILASPIVFIPLVSIAGEVPDVGSAFTQAKVMVYLVAFQNGFFWKHFFDQRMQAPAAPRTARSTAKPA